MLSLNNVEMVYDDVILVLRGLSLTVEEGEIVALLGPNGAGKTTTLKAVAGLLESEHGSVTDGEIMYNGRAIHRQDPSLTVRDGVSLVMEGRRVFAHLSVHDNLIAGGYIHGDAKATDDRFKLVYGYFPRLADRRKMLAGYLSGGEQQMLAIGRALMARPNLLLLDEPSLGLAPLLVDEIFGIVKRLNDELGTTVLLVEQNARRALGIADRGFIMESGRIVLDGSSATLRNNPDVRQFYMGLGSQDERTSYRDVKHYKRRKRWL